MYKLVFPLLPAIPALLPDTDDTECPAPVRADVTTGGELVGGGGREGRELGVGRELRGGRAALDKGEGGGFGRLEGDPKRPGGPPPGTGGPPGVFGGGRVGGALDGGATKIRS